MKKVLFFATTHMHIRVFHVPYIKWFKEHGYEVHVAGKKNDEIPEADKCWHIDIQRNPFSLKNIIAYKQLKKIIEEEQYILVTCHTAMGGVIARLAAKRMRKTIGLKMLYTAHGFHFFKDGPIKNWALYYPIEKYLSRYTDAIITINQQDYELVKNRNFKNVTTYKIPGIGINVERFEVIKDLDKIKLRKEYNYSLDEFILIYIAEFIPRKNHEFLITAMKELIKIIPNVRLLFAGKGKLFEEKKALTNQLGLSEHIEFLGFRKDIAQLIAISDVGVSSSKQEGLGLNLAEEMFCGVPVVATEDRGHKELITHSSNGFIFKQGDSKGFIAAINYLFDHPVERKQMGINAEISVQKFRLENSMLEMEKIYKNYL